jgi:hypothetical protein
MDESHFVIGQIIEKITGPLPRNFLQAEKTSTLPRQAKKQQFVVIVSVAYKSLKQGIVRALLLSQAFEQRLVMEPTVNPPQLIPIDEAL